MVLEESIIRPSCVKDLVLCKNRLNQVISVGNSTEMRISKKSNSLKFTHAWKEKTGVLDPGYDKALMLLSDTEKNDVIGYFSKLITVTKETFDEVSRTSELELPRRLEEMKMRMEEDNREMNDV